MGQDISYYGKITFTPPLTDTQVDNISEHILDGAWVCGRSQLVIDGWFSSGLEVGPQLAQVAAYAASCGSRAAGYVHVSFEDEDVRWYVADGAVERRVAETTFPKTGEFLTATPVAEIKARDNLEECVDCGVWEESPGDSWTDGRCGDCG